MSVRIHARVCGRVQGVGFRFFTQSKARQLGLVGYVRNRPDGDVEMEVEGVEDVVSEFVEAIKLGPPGARVLSANTEPRQTKAGESDFDIRF